MASSLLYAGFNAEKTEFLCGTTEGFLVYSCNPFKQRIKRDFYGGIRYISMLQRSNIFALVGTGKSSLYKATDVMIWDDQQQKCIAQLSFKTDVKNVMLTRERVVVTLVKKVFVYNFDDLKLLEQIDTVDNYDGISDISVRSPHTVACPGLEVGAVIVSHYDINDLKSIKAHNNKIQRLTLNQDGSSVATCSSVGSLIRIFNTDTGHQTHEFRRGMDSAMIYSLAFHPAGFYLALTSDKATVHIYSLHDTAENTHSSLTALSGILPSYFSSEWSFVKFKVKDNILCRCGFSQDKMSIMVLFLDGTFNVYYFDALRGGDAQLDKHHMYLDGHNLNRVPNL